MITFTDVEGQRWNEIDLPEVPLPFQWKIRDDGRGSQHLVLFVCGDTNDHPFVLWAHEQDIKIRIGHTWRLGATDEYEGATQEEGIHLMTARVLLGMWGDIREEDS